MWSEGGWGRREWCGVRGGGGGVRGVGEEGVVWSEEGSGVEGGGGGGSGVERVLERGMQL